MVRFIISSAILITKEQQKKTLKSRKNLTNSVNYELDNEQSESVFYYLESIKKQEQHWKWQFYVPLYVKYCLEIT